MKAIMNGIEVDCTVEEFKRLINKGDEVKTINTPPQTIEIKPKIYHPQNTPKQRAGRSNKKLTGVIYHCKQCGRGFRPQIYAHLRGLKDPIHKPKYCNRSCAARGRHGHQKLVTPIKTKTKIKNKQKSWGTKRSGHIVVCDFCGRQYRPTKNLWLKYKQNPNKKHFCSLKCSGKKQWENVTEKKKKEVGELLKIGREIKLQELAAADH